MLDHRNIIRYTFNVSTYYEIGDTKQLVIILFN